MDAEPVLGGSHLGAGATIVTIDGPAGAGKSSTAREVARRLGYRYLDSGALYRALTYALLVEGVPEDRWPELTFADLDALGLDVQRASSEISLWLQGAELVQELRAPEVTERVSALARLPEVRAWLLSTQRELGRAGRLVADGRDMGTVVFPDAAAKVFLKAEPAERARRRLLEMGSQRPTEEDITRAAARLAERDRMDSERVHAPLRVAPDAWVLDTTALTFDEQVEAVVRYVRERAPAPE